jgi:hypothetical protein
MFIVRARALMRRHGKGMDADGERGGARSDGLPAVTEFSLWKVAFAYRFKLIVKSFRSQDLALC